MFDWIKADASRAVLLCFPLLLLVPSCVCVCVCQCRKLTEMMEACLEKRILDVLPPLHLSVLSRAQLLLSSSTPPLRCRSAVAAVCFIFFNVPITFSRCCVAAD